MKTIHLKCKLCDGFHDYHFDENKIIAIEANWKNPQFPTALLANIPKENDIYELHLSSPIRIDLAQLFWVVYQSPLVQYNGFENETDIKSLRFCLCKAIEIKSLTLHEAELLAEVVKCLDLNHHRTVENLNLEQINFLQSKVGSKYFECLDFKNYTLLDINVESDLGMSVFLQKKGAISRIVAVNEWDFHRNIWHLLWSDELAKEQKLQYGI